MELWLLEVEEGNSYSYSGTVSIPKGVYSTEQKAHDAGKELVKSGFQAYSVDKYILDKTY